MDTPRDQPSQTKIDDVVTRYLEATAKGQGSGNYRDLAASALGRWTSWLEPQGIRRLETIDDGVMRSYAQNLRCAVRDGDLAASTANTYYAAVRACLTWAVEDGHLTDNPAAASRATSELPEDTSEPNRQFWPPGDIHTLLADLTDRIDAAVAEDGLDAAVGPLRDRALVSLLASTGVRGAEVFRDTSDDRDGRQGLRWRRVDLDSGTLHVLGKNQEWEHAQLPGQAREHLRRHKDVQQPASEEWPVFPTQHTPSLYDAARTQLGERDWAADVIENILDEQPAGDVLREYDILPPAITVRGARSVMQRLCERAGLDVDGEYLKPHGARRGIGDLLYRESAELAQSALRHQSVRTTHNAYSHIDAAETADAVGDILSNVWGSDSDGRNSSEES
jgi:integrase